MDKSINCFDWMTRHLQFDKVRGGDRQVIPEVLQEVLDYLNAEELPMICVLDDSSPEKDGWVFYRFLHQDKTYHCKGYRCEVIHVNDAYHPIVRPSWS